MPKKSESVVPVEVPAVPTVAEGANICTGDECETAEAPRLAVVAVEVNGAEGSIAVGDVVAEDTKAVVDGVFVVRSGGRSDTVLATSAEEAASMFCSLHKLPLDTDLTVDFATVPPRDGDVVIGRMLVQGCYGLLRR